MRPSNVSALLVTKACAAALALHRTVDGPGWAPLRVLDLRTASNCLLHALLWRLWAAGVAAIRGGVVHWAITSANANRVLLSLPATAAVDLAMLILP